MHNRPNVINIGAGKAGTTSLHKYMSQHPEIFGSEEKELMYFSSRFGRGVEWYRSNFPEQEGVRVYFETTPQYSFRDEFPLVPQRIHDFNPEMRLIYIVREPLSRITSHFNHWSRVNPDRYTDIEQTLANAEQRKFFVDRTRYFYQISAYFDIFPEEQVKVVFLEDIKNNFVPSMNEVCRFLGVTEIAASIEPTVHNRGATNKRTGAFRDDISPERSQEICQTLSEDVQQLLSHCGKPRDFWGVSYT